MGGGGDGGLDLKAKLLNSDLFVNKINDLINQKTKEFEIKMRMETDINK